MIYLIGGTPRSGKSTLASLILERNHISCISTDIIRNLLDFSPTKLGILEIEESKRPGAFYPYLYKLLRILQNKYPDYVVEGDIFTPDQVNTLKENIELKCCFLGSKHINKSDLLRGDIQPDWVSKLTPQEQSNLAENIIKQSEKLKTETANLDMLYFDTSLDREKVLEEAYQLLMLGE